MDKKNRIIIIGGGFGGVYAARYLLQDPLIHASCEITLISDQNYFTFTPLLHEVATGGIIKSNVVFPIAELCKSASFHFMRGTVSSIDVRRKAVHIVAHKKRVQMYDLLIVATGAEQAYLVPGAQEHAYSLKTLQDAATIKDALVDLYEHARAKVPTIAVIGGGPTGVELVSELAEFAKQLSKSRHRVASSHAMHLQETVRGQSSVHLFHAGSRLLPQLSEQSSRYVAHRLQELGVQVHLNSAVSEIAKGKIISSEGKLSTDVVIWAGGVVSRPVFPGEKAKQYIGKDLRVMGNQDIFALGDCISTKECPPLAQVAVQQARHISVNIHNILSGKKTLPFVYHAKGLLVSLGQYDAIGEIGRVRVHGFFAWWLWRTVYLYKLIGIKNKLRVMLDWTILLFSARNTAKV